MVDHVRKQIRDAVVTAVTNLTTTDTNVFPSRVYNLQDSEVPGLLVYTNDEASGPQTMSIPRSLERNLEVIIEGVAKSNTDLDDILDTIAKEVETAIAADVTLGGLTKDITLTLIEIGLTGSGQNPLGNARMTFTANYFINEDDVTTAV